MNILVTGATGFIGTALLECLRDHTKSTGDQIVLLSSCDVDGYTCIKHRNYTFTMNDFLVKGVEFVDIVFHLGAFIPKEIQDANNINQCFSNIEGTKHLCDNLPSLPKRFIFASTVDVYAPQSPLDEATPIQPVTLYGQSKLYCEHMLESWAVQKGVVLQVLRIGHIYGVGEEAYKKIIPQTIKGLIQGHPPCIFTSGREKRSFMHVSDCCRLLWKAAQLNTYDGPINLASGRALSILELVNMLMEISGTGLKPIVENRDLPTRDYVFNTAKMERLLGAETLNLENGLREEYAYIRSKQN
ncbi:NAD(P)-dependent oxidoreductase [Sporomusa sp.]|uniref:NAD-dependent epimerase/dehydratase family protein n=1 Tax=Sporomusa sp. TaxID=2078658 RepID=UPI002C5E401F|nr:NAD(P)-dependent oxidoreductase [Sporomusa sp.]HWR45844.1 NAD(P)-dependent oxidoreductase [Sporomusa sp.]